MKPSCFVIVGASGVGKSTLVRAVRAAGLPIDIPPRFVTRPPREGDGPDENVFLTAAEFEAQAAGMAVHWSRTLAPRRVERYGFPRTARLPLYSANNAWPRDAIAGALIIGVVAPEAVRLERLQRRSPEQWRRDPGELAHRMADPSDDVRAWAHVVLDEPTTAAARLIQLISSALPS